ncbi:MAG TPA: hypothetical protein VGX46_03665, partial [Vicinamibacterales bacterium]|nr:hypothetical protein [Vicinamibacterales bacterium]
MFAATPISAARGTKPAAKVVSIALYLVSGAVVVAIARELRLPPPAGGVAAFAYMGVPHHAYHALSG